VDGSSNQPESSKIVQLRKVNETELLARAGEGLPLAKKGPAAHKVLAAESVAGIFGLDMAEGAAELTAAPAKPARRQRAKAKPVKQAPKQAEDPPAASGRKSQSAERTKTAKTRGAAAKKSSAAHA